MNEPTRDEGGRWLPGTPSPNPGGRPRNPWRVMLERVAAELDANSGVSAVEAILRVLADAARDGDVQAASVLLDRLIPKARGDDAAEPVTELDHVLASFPRHLRAPLVEAVAAHREGGDAAWAFETHLRQQLDQAQRDRLFRAAVGTLGITKDPTAFDAALARLPAEDIEHLDRITTELRVQPVRDRIERESF